MQEDRWVVELLVWVILALSNEVKSFAHRIHVDHRDYLDNKFDTLVVSIQEKSARYANCYGHEERICRIAGMSQCKKSHS